MPKFLLTAVTDTDNVRRRRGYHPAPGTDTFDEPRPHRGISIQVENGALKEFKNQPKARDAPRPLDDAGGSAAASPAQQHVGISLIFPVCLLLSDPVLRLPHVTVP